MMNVISLTAEDARLMAERYAKHANSQRRMAEALLRADAQESVARLDALRSVERAFDIDLGLVCHLYERRDRADRHPIERMIVEFITDARNGDDGVWILPERVRQVKDLMQGHVVG